ncbi:MAG TPA: UDP-N-acetylglucosamine 2-epimerase (non-hydrolyzing) [Thermoanaerobaculia bacterium]|jgi:UDP-N-acetylglucosamine 2-epimerase (non-hydrolysing)
MKLLHVVGARPNFMKAAPVLQALAARGTQQVLVHTGQHYDAKMSDIFFQHLGMPAADVNLGVGSASHTVQTAEVMTRFEPVIAEHRPDWVLVYGDVNSTMAAALVCAKMLVKVAHVEGGLRSGDRTMPEEINRLVTDAIADLLLTPSEDADRNLRAEGVPETRIVRVGNVMIDTLVRLLPIAREREVPRGRYALVTLHRPSNVDEPARLQTLFETVAAISRDIPIVFPIHPRTREALRRLQIDVPGTLTLMEPLGYLDFLALQAHATLVITDSGGVQEETTYLGIPCFTLRPNTERPVTVTTGTNVLIGDDLERLRREVALVLQGKRKEAGIPELWDGHAAERIADVLLGGGRG